MAERRALIDESAGEARGVVLLEDRPERLIIRRASDPPVQMLGARSIARVRQVDQAKGFAFLEMACGTDGILEIRGSAPALPDGRFHAGRPVEVEVRAEARNGKGPVLRLVGSAKGAPRLTRAGPGLTDHLARFAPDARIERGAAARDAADLCEEEVLAREHALPGGGRILIDPVAALTAVDVDLSQHRGADTGRATLAANLSALTTAARVLRLKGLAGLVAIDLIGAGRGRGALAAAAKKAFSPDGPEVAFAPISRFGVLELAIPRRLAPTLERLVDEQGRLSAVALAHRLLRRLEQEAAADRGARLCAHAAPEVVKAASSSLPLLLEVIGQRATITADPGRPLEAFEVIAQ
ncbi:MAG: ribonuclease E/G [Caulobacteraceae bacterium]